MKDTISTTAVGAKLKIHLKKNTRYHSNPPKKKYIVPKRLIDSKKKKNIRTSFLQNGNFEKPRHISQKNLFVCEKTFFFSTNVSTFRESLKKRFKILRFKIPPQES